MLKRSKPFFAFGSCGQDARVPTNEQRTTNQFNFQIPNRKNSGHEAILVQKKKVENSNW